MGHLMTCESYKNKSINDLTELVTKTHYSKKITIDLLAFLQRKSIDKSLSKSKLERDIGQYEEIFSSANRNTTSLEEMYH